MEYTAVAKSIRMGPRKVRLVADSIRKIDSIDKSLSVLALLSKRAASPIEKTLKSALSNAINRGAKKEDLFIKSVEVMEGSGITRLGPVYNWSSRWFDDKRYKETMLEDYKLRGVLMKRLEAAGISNIEIERSINSIKLIVYVLRPGMVIGRAGTGMDDLRKFLLSILPGKQNGKNAAKLDIRIEPVKEPNLDAYLVAKSISDQLLKRFPHRRVMNQSIGRIMGAGAKGARIVLSGRIGGAEIGRREKLQQGKVPLSTIRENIEFASVPALTKKGYVGVKVWINRGEK